MSNTRANQILDRIPESDIIHIRDYYLRFGAEQMDNGRKASILKQPTPYARVILMERILKMAKQ